MKNIDYNSFIGLQFGYLTITGFGEPKKRNDGRNHVTANWKCKCGKEGNSVFTLIKAGHTNSCGCYRYERVKKVNSRHGLSSHPLYQVYEGMNDRCYNPMNKQYHDYGGRGIIVCESWVNDKLSFFNWALQSGWAEGLEIDRINNDDNYSPANCRFVTRKVNNRNKRNNRLVVFKNESKTLAEWCEILSFKYTIALRRIYRGWTTEEVFNTPIGQRIKF